MSRTFVPIITGTGSTVEKGDKVNIKYTAKLEGQPEEFESSVERGEPL